MKCLKCSGKGQIYEYDDEIGQRYECPLCNNIGYTIERYFECPKCKGGVRQKWLLKGTCSTTNGTFVHQYGEDLNTICNYKIGMIPTDLPLKKWCLQDEYYIPVHPKAIAVYKYFEYCLANK